MTTKKISKKHLGKCFCVSYDDTYDSAKKLAEEWIEKEINHYDELKRIVKISSYKLALELQGKDTYTCPKCMSMNNIHKINRMEVYGGLFWTASKPSNYLECRDCGEQFEIKNTNFERYRELAIHKIKSAKNILVNKYSEEV